MTGITVSMFHTLEAFFFFNSRQGTDIYPVRGFLLLFVIC